MAPAEKKFFINVHVSVELPNWNRNGRKLGIARWENANEMKVSDENGNGNGVIEMGGILYEKSVRAHL